MFSTRVGWSRNYSWLCMSSRNPSVYFMWFISQAQFCYISAQILSDCMLQGHFTDFHSWSLSLSSSPSTLLLTLCSSVLVKNKHWLLNSKTHILLRLSTPSHQLREIPVFPPPFLKPQNFHRVFSVCFIQSAHSESTAQVIWYAISEYHFKMHFNYYRYYFRKLEIVYVILSWPTSNISYSFKDIPEKWELYFLDNF